MLGETKETERRLRGSLARVLIDVTLSRMNSSNSGCPASLGFGFSGSHGLDFSPIWLQKAHAQSMSLIATQNEKPASWKGRRV